MTAARTAEPVDPAMLELFQAEIDTHIPVLTEGLLALEKDPSQTKRLEALMRAAHSIKGAARIVGVEPAVRLAHVMEDCMVAAQAGRIALAGEAFEILLRGVDMLARTAQGSAEGEGPAFSQLIERIAAVQSGNVASSPPAKATEVPRAVTVSGEGPEKTLTPAGNLDRPAAEDMRQILIGLLDQGASSFRFDLTKVEEMEPAGLAVLAVFPRMVAKRGRPATLQMAQVRPDVRALLHYTQLDRDYQFVD